MLEAPDIQISQRPDSSIGAAAADTAGTDGSFFTPFFLISPRKRYLSYCFISLPVKER